MYKKILSNYFLFLICIISFLLLLFFNLNLNSSNSQVRLCSELNYKESLYLHPKNFKQFDLELKILNERKWRKIAIEEELQRKKIFEKENRYYFYLNRERVKASFVINVDKKIKCKILANIRIHGDLMDHRRGSGLPSLNVNLTDGHIFGVVKFILFRPVTRNYNNEIFTANLMRELGFLSPRTTSVKIGYNNLNSRFIFQEKIEKEFLESSKQREGALFEGDERFISYDPNETINLSKHRLINKKWARKNNVNLTLSETALSILNEVNQYHRVRNPEASPFEIVDYYTVVENIGMENYFDKIPAFDSIMYVMEGDHSLTRNNRRFYYDSNDKKFIPIYYDGLTNLLTQNNNINNLPINKIKNINKKKSRFRTGKISPSAVRGSPEAYKILENLNIDNFQNKLKTNGLNLSDKKLIKLIEIIKDRLLILSKFEKERIFNITSDIKSRSFMSVKFNTNNFKRRFLYYDKNFSEYLSCDIYGNNCKKIHLDMKQKTQALAQEFKDKENNHLIFIGKKRKQLANSGWFSHYIYNEKFSERVVKKNIYSKNSSIIKYGNINLKIDKKNKIIEINKNDKNGRIVFKDGKLENWKIIFKNNFIENNNISSRIDENGYTGCLSFIDVEIKDSSFELFDSDCEDAINFIRSSGKIKSLIIKNSLFDAMDADFSILNFETTKINNAKNDCLDLSYGEYNFNSINVEMCGDKGISVGELSTVKIINTSIFNSKVGIASKDFANVKINKGIVENAEYCLAVYNKKQEFSGGFVTSKKFKCSNFSKKFLKDNQSTLEVNFQ